MFTFRKQKTKRNKIRRLKKERKIASFKYKGFKIQIVNTGYFYPHEYEWILIPMTTQLRFKMNLAVGAQIITDYSSTDSPKFCKKDAEYFIRNTRTNCRSKLSFRQLCCGQ